MRITGLEWEQVYRHVMNVRRLEQNHIARKTNKVTLVDGVFDPLHEGHIAYFKAAYDLGLPVVCNISSSTKRKELLTPSQRGQVIGSLKWISDVTYKGAEGALQSFPVRYYVKGDDWDGRLPEEQVDICEQKNVDIVFTPTRRNSSTRIVETITGSLDDFEEAINAQKEPEPWTNTYTLEERREAEGKHPKLIKEVFNPEFVLDMGAGPGYLVKFLMEEGVSAVGVDNQRHKSEELGIWIELGDICTYSDYGRWDLVICREVLEHLPVLKIQKAVENLCLLTTRYVYVTTRFSNDGFFKVGTELDVDPTHVSCLDKDMLRLMFVLQGMRRRSDLEEKMDWMNKGRVLVYEKAA